jgi:REP element-mobilizing transposase RayT
MPSQQINLPHRKSIRLKEYDYASPAEYFITICTYERGCLFGEITRERMHLNPLGLIVQEEWLKTQIIRPEIELDEFIIMPNHLHGIIIIKETHVGTHGRASLRGITTPDASMLRINPQAAFLQRQPRSLGAIIAGFKSSATKRINVERKMPYAPVWQPRFYEHIIRNDKDLNNVREYIINNPLQWHVDEENPCRDV